MRRCARTGRKVRLKAPSPLVSRAARVAANPLCHQGWGESYGKFGDISMTGGLAWRGGHKAGRLDPDGRVREGRWGGKRPSRSLVHHLTVLGQMPETAVAPARTTPSETRKKETVRSKSRPKADADMTFDPYLW